MPITLSFHFSKKSSRYSERVCKMHFKMWFFHSPSNGKDPLSFYWGDPQRKKKKTSIPSPHCQEAMPPPHLIEHMTHINREVFHCCHSAEVLHGPLLLVEQHQHGAPQQEGLPRVCGERISQLLVAAVNDAIIALLSQTLLGLQETAAKEGGVRVLCLRALTLASS